MQFGKADNDASRVVPHAHSKIPIAHISGELILRVLPNFDAVALIQNSAYLHF